MANYTQGKEDAKYIISALRGGLAYSKIGDTMLALMQLIEDYCQQAKSDHSSLCCQELVELAKDADVQAASNVDPAYTQGVAHMFQGAMFLSKDSSNEGEVRAVLQSAGKAFERSQVFFHEACAEHSEAVALLALGIVCQRQYECNLDSSAEQHRSKALKALQRSVTIFGNLGDGRQYEVRLKLAEVGELFQKNLEKRKTRDIARPMTNHQGKDIPIVGRIAAGEPILADENIEDYILVDDELAERVTFALRVHGDSMIEAAILDNDLVLIEQTQDLPPNGQIAAVMVEQIDSEATLKRFYNEKDHIRLESANPTYEPIFVIETESLSEKEIKERQKATLARYKQTQPPKRLPDIQLVEKLLIIGWARSLIRLDVNKRKGPTGP
jgi:SOS regulatory protein LexA